MAETELDALRPSSRVSGKGNALGDYRMQIVPCFGNVFKRISRCKLLWMLKCGN
jgi:hypothetical protein